MKRSLLHLILVLLIWPGAICTYASGFSNDLLQERSSKKATGDIDVASAGAYATGGRNFLVPSLPNIVNIPFLAAIPDLSASENASLWRGFFNTRLELMLQGFDGMESNINLYFIDILSIFEQYAVGGQDWQDLFWTNGFQVSAVGHNVVQQTATVAAHPIPEPGSLLLLATGMTGIAWCRRRKKPARQGSRGGSSGSRDHMQE